MTIVNTLIGTNTSATKNIVIKMLSNVNIKLKLLSVRTLEENKILIIIKEDIKIQIEL